MSDRPRERDRRRFDYTPPSYEDIRKRADDKGGMFDSIFKDGLQQFQPKEGDHLVRILPPSWPKAKHYGYEAFLHRNIGPGRGQTFLCLKENQNSPYDHCPICDELYKLGRQATKEDEQQLRPMKRVVFYVIDRDAENEGVLAWVTSGYLDSEIAAQSINRRRGNWINIIDPDEGYDISFTRVGTTMKNTRYKGFQVMRDSTPLADREKQVDEWLDFIADHPIPDMLNFVSPEKIESVFKGAVSSKEEDEDEDQPRRARDRRPNGHDEEDESRPIRRTRREEDEDEERSSKTAEKEEDERPRRSRSDDSDVDERPRRNRDEEEEETRPARRARDEEEEEEDRPSRRARTSLEKDLDDHIPFDKKEKEPESDPEEEERPRRRRSSLDEDDKKEEDEKPTRTRRASSEDEDEKPSEESRKDRNERVRERLRERVNRE